ncbi:MAG: PorT family protein [Balneolia bacterium]|nr:PorT family protein [Balneolia bacterium]
MRYLSLTLILALTVCISTLLNTQTAFASQDGDTGFIIDLRGERVDGFFPEMRSFDRATAILFIPEGETVAQELTADDFRSAEFATGEVFRAFPESVSNEEAPAVIGQKIHDSDISLYVAEPFPRERYFFAINRAGSPVFISPNRYIIQLRSIFGECGTVVREYSDIAQNYTPGYMMRIFQEYDRCMGVEDDVTRRFGTDLYRIKFGVIGGPSNSKVNQSSPIDIFRNNDYIYTIDYMVGIFADIRLQRSSIFVRPEINYMKVTSEASGFDIVRNVDQQATAELEMITLELPARYEFGFWTVRPYLGGGLSVAYIFNEDVLITDTTAAGDVFTARDINLSTNISPGFHAVAGTRFHELLGSFDLFTEVRYRYAYSDEKRFNALSGISAFNFLVGISF